MAHRRFTHLFRRRAPAARALAALIACGLPRLLHAQSSSPSPAGLPALGSYRTPAIALVQPASGGTVPQDKPVVVFRFAQGEPDDHLDLRSFAVSIDGRDVSAGFQIVGSDAWGSLAPLQTDGLPSVGVHAVTARICSERGACATVNAAVSIAQDGNAVAPSTQGMKKRDRFIDALLRVTKKLLQ